MRVLVLNNTRATWDNPKQGGYISNIGRCIESAGFEVEYLLPRKAGTTFIGKLIRYLHFYFDIVRFDFSTFDLVYINHYPYLAVPLLFRRRCLKAIAVHWHGEDLLPRSRIRALLFAPLIRLLPNQTWHFVPSEYFKRQLKSQMPGAKVIVSPSGGVNLDQFSMKEIDVGQKVVRVGFASGLSAGKGLAELKRVISHIDRLGKETGRDIEIHYIDYGPASGMFGSNGLVQHAKLIRWNILPPDEMVRFYHAIDILLFPTRRKAESLGLIPLEAMACGLPVVATNGFACKEYVVPGLSGELFDPDAPMDIVNQLVTCIRRMDTYRPREIIEKSYASSVVIRQYQEQLPKILHG